MSSDAKSSSVVNLFKLLISVTFTEASLIGVLPTRSAPAGTMRINKVGRMATGEYIDLELFVLDSYEAHNADRNKINSPSSAFAVSSSDLTLPSSSDTASEAFASESRAAATSSSVVAALASIAQSQGVCVCVRYSEYGTP